MIRLAQSVTGTSGLDKWILARKMGGLGFKTLRNRRYDNPLRPKPDTRIRAKGFRRNSFKSLVLLIGAMALLCSGCAHRYEPPAAPARDRALPDGDGNASPVAFVNAHSPGEVAHIGRTGTPRITPVEVDLHVWADTIIARAREALETGSVVVSDGVPKSLAVHIDAARMRKGEYAKLLPVISPSCQLNVTITTGDGQPTAYSVKKKAPYRGWKKACDTAGREVVAEILADREILRYLAR